jgi:transposase InsO family protein
VDNGSAFCDAAIKRAAARLGIKITHSAPGTTPGSTNMTQTIYREDHKPGL